MKQLYPFISTFLLSLMTIALSGQSSSFGNTYIHEHGESVIFGHHNFQTGGYGVLPGIVATERENDKGFLGFSNLSSGWTGANNQNYVDGYVKYYGTDPFTFPVGDNGYFRPVAISGGAAEVRVAYYRTDPNNAVTTSVFGGDLSPLPGNAPFSRSNKEPLLNAVSDIEYWDINGTKPTEITLTWNFDSELSRLTANDINKLCIVGWNGQEWVKVPSKVDIIYMRPDQSAPSFNGGVSNLVQGSISSTVEVVPDEYEVYTFGAVGLAMIGDFVWEDMNRNGLQEANEPALEGILVELYDENKEYVSSTLSDQFGRYFFDEVIPGDYYVKFSRPATYQVTLPGKGDAAINSDVTFTDFSPIIKMEANEINFGIDGGFYRNGSIGNKVWLDDGDGMQEEDEGALADIFIELIDVSGEIIASTITDEDGDYLFTNIPPGIYQIRFVPPAGYEFSPVHSVLDQTMDSDADPITGKTVTFELLSGQQIMNIDAGLSAPCDYAATIDVKQPTCGIDDGEITINIEGETGPYVYQWSNGATTNNQFGLAPGIYEIIVTDAENCPRAFTVELEFEGDCEPICGRLETAVFLEGTFDEENGLMYKRLNNLGYLPGQIPTTFFGKYTDAGQPYGHEPWHYYGEEGKGYTSKNRDENNEDYPIESVDWVLVSLRERVDVEYATCTRAGLLMEDGSIRFMEDDCCYVNPTKEYYIVIEHRNHLIVMSQEPQPVVDGEISYDFRVNQSYTRLFGYGQKEVVPGLYAMYAANGDQYLSGESPVDINVNDLKEWLDENGQHSSYYLMDFDLNGDANVQDKGLYLKNIGIFTDVPKN